MTQEIGKSSRPKSFILLPGTDTKNWQLTLRGKHVIVAGDNKHNLPLRFGPILSAGGRRRLNVAATRAKQRVIDVSSFLYSDINSTQVRPGTGLEFLKSYIEYAGSGGRLLTHGELTTEPMNDFGAEVYDALSSKGINLVPQLGCSKFRIDLAACPPTAPGKYVLAIECDGATLPATVIVRASSSSKSWDEHSTGSGRPIGSSGGMKRLTVRSGRFTRRSRKAIGVTAIRLKNCRPSIPLRPRRSPPRPSAKGARQRRRFPFGSPSASIQRWNSRISCAGSNPTAGQGSGPMAIVRVKLQAMEAQLLRKHP